MSDLDDVEHSPQDDRPPRNRLRLGFTITIWLVLIAVVVAIFSPLHDVALNHIFPPSITPTATVTAGENQFYIQASPQGNITIDGRTVTKLPAVGTGTPIQLSRGQHKIVWQAPPFLPLTCIVSVPPLASEPCNYESLGNSPIAPGLRLITFSATLADLPNAQQTALKQAIQAALDRLQSTDTVQPGEQYLYAPSSGTASVKTATQPLQATLRFQLDANLASQNSCQNGFGNSDTCSLNGQNCLQLCTDIFQGIAQSQGKLTWDLIALFYPTWTYTAQNGQVVAQNQPDTNNANVGQDHSMEMQVIWNGTKWLVSLYVMPEAVSQYGPSPACASLNNQISATLQYGVTGTGKNVDWGFVTGPNEAQGCLAVVVASPGQQTPTTDFKQPSAYFLYRFGILLAANPLAHSEFPGIPMADANEQSIAQGIAAKLKF